MSTRENKLTKAKHQDSAPRKNSDWTTRSEKGLRILMARPLASIAWLVHGFSTRPGGSSELDNGSGKTERVLNLGFTDWDERNRVMDNRKKFTTALDAPSMKMTTLKQIHSDLAHRVDGLRCGEALKGDALLTRDPGILLAVQTADCIPILLADTRTRSVAAVHSGWRGTLGRIVEKTLGRMRMEFGTQPEDVIAALGPGIGGCCYEVGHEVAKEFAAQFHDAREWFDGPFDAIATGDNDPNWLPWLTMAPPGHAPEPGRVRLDLLAANRAILISAGVPSQNIFDCGLCTACRTDLFFSYRKERMTGRLMAAIGIRDGV